MKLHSITISKEVCTTILHTVERMANCTSNSTFSVTHTKGGLNEINTVKTLPGFDQDREGKILEFYKNYQESGYTNFSDNAINELIPNNIFEYFKLDKNQCKIDVKKFQPGKIHIPHKDYYINLKYNLIDNNGMVEYQPIINDDADKEIIRLWITLTEPRFGHLLIVEDSALYWLEQGSIVTWESHELHAAANLGYEDRYIMTITGKVVG